MKKLQQIQHFLQQNKILSIYLSIHPSISIYAGLEVSVSWNFTCGAHLLEASAFLFDREDPEKPGEKGKWRTIWRSTGRCFRDNFQVGW